MFSVGLYVCVNYEACSLHMLSSLAALILLFSVLTIPIWTNIPCHSAALIAYILQTLCHYIHCNTIWPMALFILWYYTPIWTKTLCKLYTYKHLWTIFTHSLHILRCSLCHIYLDTKLAFTLCGLVYYDHLTNMLAYLLWWLIYFRQFDTISAMILYTLWPFVYLYTILLSVLVIL